MLLSGRVFRVLQLLVLVVFGLLFASSAIAMQELAEEEMAEITAGSFATFTMEEIAVDRHRATVGLNIRAETYAEIGSFKANYRAEAGMPDWDQDWQNVVLGTSVSDPLKLEGFILQAEFQDLASDANRELLRLTIGFDKVNGALSADSFSSFTGSYDTAPAAYRQDLGGPGAFTFTDDRIHMTFDTNGHSGPGVYIDFGGAQYN